MAKKVITKRNSSIHTLVVILSFVAIIGTINFLKQNGKLVEIYRPNEESFEAPGRDWPSEKKVEDYFVSTLHMTPEEAKEIRFESGVDGKVMLRLRENTTIDGLIDNLEYYGFVKDKEALRYALEYSTDTKTGHQEALKVGENTVDIWAYYRISEDMTAWEIADELLNNPSYFAYDEYNYIFMP